MKILFVDDCEDDLLLAVAALRREGLTFEATFAATLAEAREELARGGWSAVVSDYNLVGHDGLDVLRVTRELAGDVPFLLLSGTIGEERAAEAIRAGAADYVMKDRPARLAAVIRRELETAESRRTRAALEARLRAAEQRYRRTLERAPIGIVNADARGRLISVNTRFCDLLGYADEELLGRSFNDFGSAEDAQRARDNFDALIAGRHSTARYQRRYVRKNGHLTWADVTLALVRDERGAVDYIIGLVEDVTERKLAGDKLLMQARLLDSVDQAVMATDLEGRITYWNSFAERLYGWTSDEVLGAHVMDITPCEQTHEKAAEIMARLQRGECWTGEIVLRRRDGTTFPALVIDAPITDEHGTLIGIVGVSYDLTEQKRTENALREHKLQLAEAQEIARVGSWTYDFTTGVREWSDTLLRLYGVAPGTPFTAEDALARVHPDDRSAVDELYVHAHKRLQPASVNFRIVTDAGTREVMLRYTLVHEPDGRPLKLIGVVQDVTEAKQLESELLRRAIQQTAVANLGQFALSGAQTFFILDQAVASVKDVLHFDQAAILRHDGTTLVHVVGDVWDDDTGVRTQIPIHSADGTEWGVLAGVQQKPQPSAAHDREFLLSIATVVGQTLDRAAADTELRTLARQQRAIAEMGRLVLTSVEREVFERACELLTAGTDADFVFFAELTRADMLVLRAGRPWKELPAVPAGSETQAGATIRTGIPTVVDDYRTDSRVYTRTNTVAHGVLSGVMVPVASARRSYGLLSAQSRRTRAFRKSDVEFMQTLANILAEAMERENARFEVEKSEQRHRRIFDGASEIIFSVDTAGRILTLNPAFETITGWPREEWLGRPFPELLVPEERERLVGVFGHILEQRTTADERTTLLGSNGRRIVVEVTSFPQGENGTVTEVYGFARDVTETHRATAERERVTRSLQLLLESTVEGIYTIDLDGRCTMINRSAAMLLGMAPSEVIGRIVHDLLHAKKPDGSPYPIADCPVHAVLRGADPVAVASDVLVRPDGTVIPIAYSAAPIVDGGRCVGVVVTFSDLTEHRKLEAKLEQANRLSSLGRLAATVAHEFNNVLMGIAPFVEVIRRAPSPEKVAMALDHVAGSVRRGRRITEDILRFTQPSEPVRTPVNVDGWLRGVALEARPVLGPAYSLEIDAEPLRIEGDANQLHQIFMNLILNARDAMASGGPIRITARREAPDTRFPFGTIERPERYVHIIASDTGCGMSEETLRHAFEPLFTTKKNGTGLGLAITRQVVLLHGGDIFVESTPGVGTTFHVFLPRSTAAGAAAGVELASASPQKMLPREILLVEDDSVVSAGLCALLECEGFSVRVVETGRDALDALRDTLPDAMVLDVGLPDIDGKAVYATVSRLHPKLPVIFSTGHADRGGLEELLGNPNVGYLLKPYESAALLEVLSNVMN